MQNTAAKVFSSKEEVKEDEKDQDISIEQTQANLTTK